MGDLLIAFARIGRSQFVEAFEVVRMKDVSGGADDSLLKIEEGFVRSQQVAATDGGDQLGLAERFADMIINPNPARC